MVVPPYARFDAARLDPRGSSRRSAAGSNETGQQYDTPEYHDLELSVSPNSNGLSTHPPARDGNCAAWCGSFVSPV